MSKSDTIFPELPDKFNFKTVYYKIFRIIVVNPGSYKIEGFKKIFSSFEEVYDHIENKLNGLPYFDADEVKKSEPKKFTAMSHLLVDKASRRMFLARGDEELWSLSYAYDFFKKLYKKYLKNKKDFYNAYQFLTHHPVFWSLNGELKQKGMLFWETNAGLDKMWHTIYKDKNNVLVHLLEHGPFMDSDEKFEGEIVAAPCRIPSHDIRLDVIGLTYEEAIVRLAKRVNKFYSSNGQDRENLEKDRDQADVA